MNKLIYYAGLYTASAALLKLSGFVLFLWIAKTLSVDNYANFGLLYALQSGLTTFGLVGILESVIGLLKEYQTEEQRRKLFAAANSTFLITLFSSVLIVLIFFIFISSEATTLTLIWVLASGALLSFSMLQSQIVRLDEEHLSSLSFNFIVPFTGITGSFVLFYLDRTVQSFFAGATLGLIFSTLVMIIFKIGFFNFSSKTKEILPVIVRITPFIAVALLGWLGGYGNNYIINFFFEPKEIAKFTFALSLSSVMQLIATALNQVWSPRFYKLINNLPEVKLELMNKRFFRVQGLTMGLFGGLVIALFPKLIDMVGGNLLSYRSITLELFLLFSSYVILTPWWHCQNYFLAHDRGPMVMRVILITSIIGITLWIMLMILLGPIGIYVGFFMQMLLRTIVLLFEAKKCWPIRASWDGVVAGIIILFIGFVISHYEWI